MRERFVRAVAEGKMVQELPERKRQQLISLLDKLGIWEVLEKREVMEEILRLFHGGHYTLFAFTTGYKAVLGTPMSDTIVLTEALSNLPQFPLPEMALLHAVVVAVFSNLVRKGASVDIRDLEEYAEHRIEEAAAWEELHDPP